MLRLAVATNAETYERMQSPLRERDIAPEYIPTAERAVALSDGADSYRTGDRSTSGQFDVGFVFPSRLAEGGVADGLLDIPWVNSREAILRSRQKGETLARLSRAGVPTPRTVVVSNPADEAVLKSAFERIEGPVVVKPNSTTRGIGVAKAHDLDSFLGICDYLDLVHDYRATGDRSFLVQEFLPDARDFRVMLVDAEVVGAVERRLPDEALAASGNTTFTGARRRRASHSTRTVGNWPRPLPKRSKSPGSVSICWSVTAGRSSTRLMPGRRSIRQRNTKTASGTTLPT